LTEEKRQDVLSIFEFAQLNIW